MKNYILSGYMFGVIWGLAQGFFRVSHANTPAFDWIVGTIVGALVTSGPLCALFGLVLGALALRRQRAGQGKSQTTKMLEQ